MKEVAGHLSMQMKQWDKALVELQSAFLSYQLVNNSRAKSVLKGVVFVSILVNSEINYLATTESQVYRNDPEIIAIMNL